MNRRDMRGKPLLPKCRKAKFSGDSGCQGLCKWPGSPDDDCMRCEAYIYNVNDARWESMEMMDDA